MLNRKRHAVLIGDSLRTEELIDAFRFYPAARLRFRRRSLGVVAMMFVGIGLGPAGLD